MFQPIKPIHSIICSASPSAVVVLLWAHMHAKSASYQKINLNVALIAKCQLLICDSFSDDLLHMIRFCPTLSTTETGAQSGIACCDFMMKTLQNIDDVCKNFIKFYHIFLD